MTPSWRELEARRMLCVPALPIIANYLDALGKGEQPYSRLLCEVAIKESTIVTFAPFIHAAEYGELGLFLAKRYRALQDEGRVRANKRVLIREVQQKQSLSLL